MHDYTILIAENDIFRCETLTDYLLQRGFGVICCPTNGNECLQQIIETKPSAVIINTVMKGFGACEVKRRLNKILPIESQPLFFATGFFSDDIVENELSQLGFKFYFLKPYDESFLVNELELYLTKPSLLLPVCDIDTLFLKLDAPIKLIGLTYAKTAIELLMQSPNYATMATKLLYPELAKRYNTTSAAVERALRNAIEAIFKTANHEVLCRIFPKYRSTGKKASNLEFLLNCTWYLTNAKKLAT